jgi:hypothetical protein
LRWGEATDEPARADARATKLPAARPPRITKSGDARKKPRVPSTIAPFQVSNRKNQTSFLKNQTSFFKKENSFLKNQTSFWESEPSGLRSVVRKTLSQN